MLDRLREPWSDQRAERMLGALACVVLLTIALMIVFVAIRAWPSFQHNGLSWFGGKGDIYHALQACLIPLYPATGSLTKGLAAEISPYFLVKLSQ